MSLQVCLHLNVFRSKYSRLAQAQKCFSAVRNHYDSTGDVIIRQGPKKKDFSQQFSEVWCVRHQKKTMKKRNTPNKDTHILLCQAVLCGYRTFQLFLVQVSVRIIPMFVDIIIRLNTQLCIFILFSCEKVIFLLPEMLFYGHKSLCIKNCTE